MMISSRPLDRNQRQLEVVKLIGCILLLLYYTCKVHGAAYGVGLTRVNFTVLLTTEQEEGATDHDPLGGLRSVWATGAFYSPSPGLSHDGSVVYVGGYAAISTFVGEFEGLTTRISWEHYETTTNCTAVLQWQGIIPMPGMHCANCMKCDDIAGSPAFSADCTNIENGRIIDCESSFPYFPLRLDLINPNSVYNSNILDARNRDDEDSTEDNEDSTQDNEDLELPRQDDHGTSSTRFSS